MLCACGCGQETAGGTFRPGHDTRLRAQIEASVGGLLRLDQIVVQIRRHLDGEIPANELSDSVRRIVES